MWYNNNVLYVINLFNFNLSKSWLSINLGFLNSILDSFLVLFDGEQIFFLDEHLLYHGDGNSDRDGE